MELYVTMFSTEKKIFYFLKHENWDNFKEVRECLIFAIYIEKKNVSFSHLEWKSFESHK